MCNLDPARPAAGTGRLCEDVQQSEVVTYYKKSKTQFMDMPLSEQTSTVLDEINGSMGIGCSGVAGLPSRVSADWQPTYQTREVFAKTISIDLISLPENLPHNNELLNHQE